MAFSYEVNSSALGIESFTFNGINSDDLGVVMESKDIKSPEFRERNVILANRPGVIKIQPSNPLAKFGGREIEVVCGAYIPKRANEDKFRRGFTHQIMAYGEQKLFFSRSTERFYLAELIGIEWERTTSGHGALLMKITLKFSCSQPFTYDSGGPITYTSLTDTLDNTGDVPAEAIYNLTLTEAVDAGDGNISGTGLVMNVGGSRLQINRSLPAGSQIQVGDTQIVLNGSQFLVPNMRYSQGFLEIPVGPRHFASNVPMTGTILMRRRYLD